MAYNRENYLKKAAFIVSVYNLYRDKGIIQDSRIVRNHFPKHGIYIKYRQWMNIKNIIIPKECFDKKELVTEYEKIIEEFKPKTKEQLELKF